MVQIPFAPTTYPIPFNQLQPFLKRARIRVSVYSAQLSAFLRKTASVQRTFWTEGGNPSPPFLHFLFSEHHILFDPIVEVTHTFSGMAHPELDESPHKSASARSRKHLPSARKAVSIFSAIKNPTTAAVVSSPGHELPVPKNTPWKSQQVRFLRTATVLFDRSQFTGRNSDRFLRRAAEIGVGQISVTDSCFACNPMGSEQS